MAANTGHAAPDDLWLASLQEEVLELELPIIDPHHHLWVRNGYTYLMPEFAADPLVTTLSQRSLLNVIPCIGLPALNKRAHWVRLNLCAVRRL